MTGKIAQNRNWQIKFNGETYYIISGGDAVKSGAIANKEQFYNFEESFAHLDEDGKIFRHQQQIGTIDDIKFIRRVKL